MLSELRVRKLTRYFNLVDTNGDGVFTAADSAEIIERLVAFRGLEVGTPLCDAFVSGFTRYWEDVRRDIDASEDGEVSLREWLRYHALMLASPQRYEESAEASSRLMFALIDVDGDGKLTLAEYGAWMRAWGKVDDPTIDAITRRLDINGDGLLSHDEIRSLIRDFFFSDDPEAPGNWAMGPF